MLAGAPPGSKFHGNGSKERHRRSGRGARGSPEKNSQKQRNGEVRNRSACARVGAKKNNKKKNQKKVWGK